MSGNGKNTKEGPVPVEEGGIAMPPDDMSFLVDCLKNPIGGGIIAIDTHAVAVIRGYKNAGSVANRIAKLKKRFDLPITASASGARKITDGSTSEVSVPMTPAAKNKVTKPRSGRGRAVAKVVKKADSSGEESSGDDKEYYKEEGEEAKARGGKAKKVKASDVEEGEIRDDAAGEDEEDGGEEEKSEILKVEDDHSDEV